MSEISQEVIDLLNEEITTVVAATLNEDGSPHTAPFSFVVAKDKRTLRLAIGTRNMTIGNIRRDGRMAISVLDRGDIAVSVNGKAKIVKERLECYSGVALVEVDLTSIRNNSSRVGPVTSGVRYNLADRFKEQVKAVFRELKSTP